MSFSTAKESCIGGLISILDFRRSTSTLKALLDETQKDGSLARKPGNGNSESQILVPNDAKKRDKHSRDKKRNTVRYSTSEQTSVRALMDKEMSKAKSNSQANVAIPAKPLCLESRNKGELASSNYDAGLASFYFLKQYPEKNPFICEKDFHSSGNNLEEIIVHNRHENSVLREAVSISSETVVIDEGLQPRELFNGDKIVFDKYTDNHKGKYTHFSKESPRSPYREAGVHKFPKSRFKSMTSSNSSCSSHLQLQIQDRKGELSFYFSFRKIRKTLKQAIANFALTQFDSKRAPRNTNMNLAINGDQKRRNRNVAISDSGELETLADCLRRDDAHYRKAKNHIAKTLNNGVENGITSTRQVPKRLAEVIFTIHDGISPSAESMELQSADHILYSDSSLESSEENINNLGKILHLSRGGPNSTSRISIEAENSTSTRSQNSKDDDNCKDYHNSEMSLESNLNGSIVFDSESLEERLSISSDLSSFNEEQQPEDLAIYSNLPNSSSTRKIEIPHLFNEKVQNPSPVSVLQDVLVNIADHSVEAICFSKTNSNYFSPQTTMGNTEDHGYPSESAYIDLRILLEIWNSPHKSLNPTLIGEILRSTSSLLDDPKLLFDCSDEVLQEIQKNLLVCLPWTRLIRPNAKPFPNERDLIQKVNKDIHRHINAHLAITMDELVERQMNYESWVDLFYDEERALIDVVDDSLIGLLEECIIEIMTISKLHEIDQLQIKQTEFRTSTQLPDN